MPNITNLPNLIFNPKLPGFKKIVEISKPDNELTVLKQLDALDGKSNGIQYSDFEANKEKFLTIMNQLQGLHLYADDNAPDGESLSSTLHDLATALSMLQTIKSKLGATKFSKAMVVFEEKLLGYAATEMGHNHAGRHHVIGRAFTVPLDEQPYAVPPNQLPSENLGKSGKIENFQTYENSQVKFYTVIKNPQREMALLEKISSLDGNAESISNSDINHKKFLELFNQLEGKALYGNDAGADGKIWNLDAALSILKSIQGEKGNFSGIQVYFNQLSNPINARWAIESGQVIFNEASGHSIVIQKYGEKEE